jgi:two-component system, NarL family, invasion response regulator UvrY
MKILIADDHAIFRRGVRDILAEHEPGAVFGEADTARVALGMVWAEAWDLMIMDISLPDRSGLDILHDIRKARPELPVLVLSMHTEEQYAERVLRAGAAGYLTKLHAGDELVRAVTKVSEGGRYVSGELAERLAANLAGGDNRSGHELLSAREFQVLRLIATGKTVKEIALELSISVQTVSTHRARLLRKMGLRSNAEVMRYAMERGLVT